MGIMLSAAAWPSDLGQSLCPPGLKVLSVQRFLVECPAFGVLGTFILVCYGMCNRDRTIRPNWPTEG